MQLPWACNPSCFELNQLAGRLAWPNTCAPPCNTIPTVSSQVVASILAQPVTDKNGLTMLDAPVDFTLSDGLGLDEF